MAIVAENLSKSYDGKIAVFNISFKVEPGEIVCLLGPNGSGKTTTLRMLTGLLKPDSGKVYIDSFDMSEEPAKAKKLIGFVPEESYLYENLTGYEFLQFVCGLWGIDFREKIGEVDKLAKILDMEDHLDELITTYSDGMKRKLAFMSALIHEPRYIIFDEVTANFDPKALATIRLMLRGLTSKEVGILLTTHILEIAERLADRIIIMNKGSIIAEGRLEELKEKKGLEDLFFQLTGGPEINLLLSYLDSV